VTSIDILPDDVLLAIFDFCADEYQEDKEAWHSLVHVCRRWRSVVFGSPRRLNLRLICTENTPVRDTLDVWPPLPLVIESSLSNGVGDVIAVLEHRDRVDRIYFWQADNSPLEKVLTAMLEPFPELTDLRLWSDDKTLPVLPDSFLGRSAPRLVHLLLNGIPFPGLPILLLSATHLVYLRLSNIPHSGYISPEAMATALSTLTSLDSFTLRFQSPRSHPDRASRRPPPLARTVLSVLNRFSFKGVYEYLDDLVARVDAPRLNYLKITLFNDIVFDAPQCVQFISRTPTLGPLENAYVVFEDCAVRVNFSSRTSSDRSLRMGISCRESDWQVSSLVQVCTSCLPPLSMLEDLYVCSDPYWQPHWQDNIENSLWLELLHQFTTVKNLYLSKELVLRIAPALQELVGGRTTEVFPNLQNIFLEKLQPSETVQEGVEKFVAERQVAGHPIAVSRWNRDRNRKRF
jgi:hypothetical protein